MILFQPSYSDTDIEDFWKITILKKSMQVKLFAL